MMRDLRYAWRALMRAPSVSVLAIAALAVGIGANATIFSAISGVLLAPLPFPHPSRLVAIQNGSYPDGGFAFLRRNLRTLAVAAYDQGHHFNLTGAGRPTRLEGALVSANFFRVLGVNPALGRGFLSGEDTAGQNHFVILSHAAWRQRFGGNPAIVGHMIELDGIARQVVGVMPAGFGFPSAAAQLWVPLAINPRNQIAEWAGDYMPVLGRLRPGVSAAEATSELRLAQTRLRTMFPWPMPKQWNAGLAAVPLARVLAGNLRGRLWLLLGVVFAVLLIAAANVASLQLARLVDRERDLALRAALGAGRGRILGQCLAESLLLAALGGAAGIGVAVLALPLLRSLLPPDTFDIHRVALDWRVLLFVAGVTLLAGILAGLAPAVRAARVQMAESLKAAGRSAAAATGARLRRALVAGEIALGVLLVCGAGLLIASLWDLAHADPGFQTTQVLTARITPNPAFCADAGRCVAFYRQLVGAVSALPGVRAASVINTPPLGGLVAKRSVELEGRSGAQLLPLVWENIISPGYFRSLGIPLSRGRFFRPAAGSGGPPAVILSAATAARFWPGENPIGRHLRLARSRRWLTVVGVVPDVRAFSLARPRPAWMQGTIYLPYGPLATQENGAMPAAMTLVVRARDAASLAAPIRAIVGRLNAAAPVSDIRTMAELASASTAPSRSVAYLFASFAALALLLGATGIYGLIAFLVGQRMAEFGIRLALGAQPCNIAAMVLREGLALALAGVAAGLAAAVILDRLLAGLLYGVGPADPAVLGAVAVLFALTALLACYLPARRAARADPAAALR